MVTSLFLPKTPFSGVAMAIPSIKTQRMLAELYVEALLADEALADEVWALWDAGLISDEVAALAWAILNINHCGSVSCG
jgi:hypothetical protein